MIKVSVLLPVYNCRAYVEEAINSILCQTYSNFELLIIDDLSNDGTYELIQTIKDSRIKLIRKPQNTGYTDSLNMGIELAQGEYIARMDGDDVCLPTRLQKQLDFLDQNGDVVLCGTLYQKFLSKEIPKLPLEHDDIKIALLNRCVFAHPTVMIRRNFLIEKKIRYRKELEPAEDYDLWTTVVAIGKVANIPEVLLKYREHEMQISKTKMHLQFINGGKTKIKMLGYLKEFNKFDIVNAEMLYNLREVKNSDRFTDLMPWLDSLVSLNENSGFYKRAAFRDYILNIKRNFIRNYFLNRSKYTPEVLTDFFNLYSAAKGQFSLRDKIVIAAKSITYWKRPIDN